ncbi:MAG: hypothetical protein A4E56_01899 [Pelotomaculum sp. PtaU1.Bin065]|nr:MAG: hypothetical protein A4E56_01899 [Pelotomaculum sp. PtaU1.Bin065]
MFNKKTSIQETAHAKRVKYRKLGRNNIDFLHDLKNRFKGGDIDAADVLEAIHIIQVEANLLSLDREESYSSAYRHLDLLARCVISIIENGDVKLSKNDLTYINSTMPLKFFIERYIQRVENSR